MNPVLLNRETGNRTRRQARAGGRAGADGNCYSPFLRAAWRLRYGDGNTQRGADR